MKNKIYINILIYSSMFFIILIPFLEYGFLKLFGVSIVLGYFADILNSILRVSHQFKDQNTHVKPDNGMSKNEFVVQLGGTLSGLDEIRPPGESDPNDKI